jgi:hypothetical protein
MTNGIAWQEIRDWPNVPTDGSFPAQGYTGNAVRDRSLSPGQNEEFVQWGTFRKTRSTATNVTQASLDGLTDSIGAYE